MRLRLTLRPCHSMMQFPNTNDKLESDIRVTVQIALIWRVHVTSLMCRLTVTRLSTRRLQATHVRLHLVDFSKRWTDIEIESRLVKPTSWQQWLDKQHCTSTINYGTNDLYRSSSRIWHSLYMHCICRKLIVYLYWQGARKTPSHLVLVNVVPGTEMLTLLPHATTCSLLQLTWMKFALYRPLLHMTLCTYCYTLRCDELAVVKLSCQDVSPKKGDRRTHLFVWW